MTVLTMGEARSVAQKYFGRPVTDQELGALAAAERAAHKVEGFAAYHVACAACGAFARAMEG